jgi:hypothetical protein
MSNPITQIVQNEVAQQAAQTERVGELSSAIRQDFGRLMSLSLELLKTEMAEHTARLSRLGKSLLPVVAALSIGLLLLAFALAHVLAEQTGISLGASYFIVGGVVTGLGIFAAQAVRKQAEGLQLFPVDTIEQLKENFTWLAKKI